MGEAEDNYEPVPKAFVASPKKYAIPKVTRFKFDGIFDWDDVYKFMYEWFADRGYYFEEKAIKHKVPTPAGAEEEFTFTGWRKITDYAKEEISVHFHFYEMKEVDVVKEGTQKKLFKSRVIITFNGAVETAYDERWKRTQFGHYLRSFLEKYIIKKEIDNVWTDRLYYNLIRLQSDLKEHLNLQAKANAYYDMW